MSLMSGRETPRCVKSKSVLRAQMSRRREEFGKGSGRRTTALTTLNMAVLAPMPRASVRTVTAVNPGDLASSRKP